MERAANADDAVIRVTGELDLATSPRLERAIGEAFGLGGGIVLDLSGLSFMDSSGLRVVLQLDASCRSAGRRLRIVRGPPVVQRVFELTGTAERLPLSDGTT